MLRRKPLFLSFFSLSGDNIGPFVLFCKEYCSAVNGASFYFFSANFAQTKSSTVDLSSAAILLPVSSLFFWSTPSRYSLTTSCHYLNCCNVPRSSKSTSIGISPVSLSGHVTTAAGGPALLVPSGATGPTVEQFFPRLSRRRQTQGMDACVSDAGWLLINDS